MKLYQHLQKKYEIETDASIRMTNQVKRYFSG